MKKQLEDLFSESLGKHEMPYDPAAWNALQKKLPPSGNSFLKIALVSAASVALVTVGYILYDANETQPKLITETLEPIMPQLPEAEQADLPKVKHNSKTQTQTTKVEHADKVDQQRTASPVEQTQRQHEAVDPATKSVEAPLLPRKESTNVPLPTTSTWSKLALQTRIKPVPTLICEGDLVSLQAENMPASSIMLWKLSDGKELTGNRVQFTPEGSLFITPVLVNAARQEQIDFEGFTVQRTSAQKPVLTITESMRNTKPYFIVEHKSALKNATWRIDERSSDQSKFEFYLTDKGTHTLKLQGVDQNGCTVYASETITLNETYNLFAEKAFSPNGDGLNETFIPKALLSRDVEFRMVIHDRSGSLLFETTSTDKPWDGTAINGEKARVGNYIWAISLINEEGLPEKYSGMIVITEN